MSAEDQIERNLKNGHRLFNAENVRDSIDTNKAGWYVITEHRQGRPPRNRYVGTSASDVRKRLQHHRNRSANRRLNKRMRRERSDFTFSVEEACVDEDVWDVEEEMIHRFRPSDNIQLND